MRVLAACCLLVVTPAASATPGRQQAAPVVSIAELLDAYDAGRFETVNRVVAGIPDLPKFSHRVFEDFRSSYVLRYTPARVTARGWHELEVKTTRAGRLTVRARRGYFGG